MNTNGILDIEKTKAESPSNKTMPKKSFAKLGYSKLETAEIVDNLNKLLANMSVHYQKLRNFHWNVKGGDFFDLHEKFEEDYKFTNDAIDEIAERIRVFGQTPYSTMKEYLEHSDIKESGTDLTGFEMVRQLLKDFEVMLDQMFAVLNISVQHNDSGTEDLIKGFVKRTEKRHWMYTSFISQDFMN